MAIVSLMIRRAASHTVVPHAVRAIASPGIILSNHGFINAGEHKNFSTVSATNSDSMKIVDKKLNKVLRSEIKTAEQLPLEKRVMPLTPANFPFTIVDKPGENRFTLKREIGSEKIEIEVEMPCICQLAKEEPETPEEISSSDDSSDNDDGEDGDEKQSASENDESKSDDDVCKRSIGLTIKVSKENGQTLKFSVRAYEDWNCIDLITVDEAPLAESDEDEEDNEQPPASESEDEKKEDKFIRPLFMEELSCEVQNAFRKFLEIRGIKEIDFGFLQNYVIRKHKRDRMLMLKKVKKFVKE
ncbi:hypothetical protein ACJIZ3_024073 [Penstemon smallii]|uniref:Uncharacterized protein n=1 Tax=Penstemon smallii TaxID=265156 RepID=A0ABD3TT88_9LAMI